jgi:CRISPR-associated endoribonuclease Cas6
MRIHLKISSDGSVVPFDYQKKLTGTIHKWIGEENIEHGSISLYSFSMLNNGKKSVRGNGLVFENGTSFFISAYNDALIKSIVSAIQKDPTLFSGLKVQEIIIQENPDLADKEYFLAASPIFVKRKRDDGSTKHYAYGEKETTAFLTETLQNKMTKVGLVDDTLEIAFDFTYPNAKTKVINYNGIGNNANICPVIIKAKPETKVFAWNVGIGNSTGIGFGAIK